MVFGKLYILSNACGLYNLEWFLSTPSSILGSACGLLSSSTTQTSSNWHLVYFSWRIFFSNIQKHWCKAEMWVLLGLWGPLHSYWLGAWICADCNSCLVGRLVAEILKVIFHLLPNGRLGCFPGNDTVNKLPVRTAHNTLLVRGCWHCLDGGFGCEAGIWRVNSEKCIIIRCDLHWAVCWQHWKP